MYGTDTIKARATAGTFTKRGSGAYTYKLISGAGDDDNAKFRVDEASLKIGDSDLSLRTYSVRVQGKNSAVNTATKKFTLEVAEAPAPITIAATLLPHIVDYASNKNKITASWNSAAGATGYKLYINTTNNVNTAALVSDTLTSTSGVIETYPGTGASLPRGADYYVWVKAFNTKADTDFSPVAKVRTSETVQEFWYKQNGQNIVRWDSDTDNYNIDQTTVSYNFIDTTTGGGQVRVSRIKE